MPPFVYTLSKIYLSNKLIKSEEISCTFEDLAKLEEMKCKAKQELRFAGGFVLVISVLLPFLPPKYSGTRSMLDMMSYSTTVSGIVTVLGVVFLWSVYFMLYGISRDIKKKIKVCVSTYVISTGMGNYKGRKFCYFSAAGLPYRLGRLPLNEDDYENLKKGDNVIVEYSKYGKKFLGWRKIQ